VAPLNQAFPKLAVVVDFSVEDGKNGTVLIANWLIAALQVDDTEPAHSERNVLVGVGAEAIRAAMTLHIEHIPENLYVGRSSLEIVKSTNSAHEAGLLLTGAV
jgi:hypothetical protein